LRVEGDDSEKVQASGPSCLNIGETSESSIVVERLDLCSVRRTPV
jgi:hypothetical protein